MTISASYPFTLQNGTTADATQVMANFLQIQTDVNTNAAHNGANSDITSITGLTTPLALNQGGTGSTTAAGARTVLGVPGLATANTFTGKLTMSGAAINEAVQVTIASASSVAIGAAVSNSVIITGTTTITSFDTVTAGVHRYVEFSGILTLTHNGTSLILPGAANITTAAGDTAVFESLGSGNWRCMFYSRASGLPIVAAPSTGRLLKINHFTSSGTFTPDTGTTFIIVDVLGGGGGGARGNTGVINCGGSGAGLARKRINSGFSAQAYVIGTGGAGAGSDGVNGSAGVDSTFGTVVGVAGLGGVFGSAASAVAGSVGTGGDLNLAGGDGSCTSSATVALSISGAGPIYGASRTIGGINAAGSTGAGFGSGGTGSSTGKAPGAGSDGLIVVWEYS